MQAARRSSSHATPRALAIATAVVLGAVACRFPEAPPPGADGRTIYQAQLCSNCHGEDGAGNSLGPPLRNLEAHWSVADLADFLAAPKPWLGRSERLLELSEEYRGQMNAYANLSLEERLRLGEYVLGL